MENRRMPALFIGHGSPMNAIEQNTFTKSWEDIARDIPQPKAIMCISAHWETIGTQVTAMPWPKTIHDFYGFPKALFDVQYAAPGSPEWAEEIKRRIPQPEITHNLDWGLDHGTWSVLVKMYPKADIPVFQISLSRNKAAQYHFDLAKQLQFLRDEGVLIISSGNMVHNLRILDWNMQGRGFDWAIEMDEYLKKKILDGNFDSLIHFIDSSKAQIGHPSVEHYLPLLYTIGLHAGKEPIDFPTEGLDFGSISMRSLKVG
jgi:4,5-DOPA dioxygenase extradiol